MHNQAGFTMVLAEDNVYRETLDIIRGVRALPPVFQAMKDWMKSRFGVVPYNFVFREIQYDNPDHRWELVVLLGSTADYRCMFKGDFYDHEKLKEVAARFRELAEHNRFYDYEQTADVHISYIDFSTEIKTDVNDRAYRAIVESLFEKYRMSALWKICPAFASVIVFYERDEDVRKNESQGISEKIKSEYIAELKRQDAFGAFSDGSFAMTFDSKESLDKNYNGNLYFYFK